jgi:metal-responsive CopG/Arc/MetJ family transcriptional regulator
VKKHVNVTLSLPEPLLREFRVYAAQKNQSMTALMADAIRERMAKESDGQEAEKERQKLLDRMRKSPDRGIGDKVTWTREELYERVHRY